MSKVLLEVNRCHIQEIRNGLNEVEAGEWVGHDEVAACVKSWGKPDELPIPTPQPTTKRR